MKILTILSAQLIISASALVAVSQPVLADSPDTIYVNGQPCGNFCRSWLGLPQYRPRLQREPGAAVVRSESRSRQRQARLTSHDVKRHGHDQAALTSNRTMSNPNPKPELSREEKPVQEPASENTGTVSQQAAPAASPANASGGAVQQQPANDASGDSEKSGEAISQGQAPATAPEKQSSAEFGSKPADIAETDNVGKNPDRSSDALPETPSDSKAEASGNAEEPSPAVAPSAESDPGQSRAQDKRIAALPVPPVTKPTERTSTPADGPAVAIVITSPEIRSLADLSNKRVAIDKKLVTRQSDLRNALAAVGAKEVELTPEQKDAASSVLHGETEAAVLALVGPSAASKFPAIAGYNIFRVSIENSGGSQ